MYLEQVEFIAGVTRMLNAQVPGLPDGSGFRLNIQLVDDDGNQLGWWSDEIAEDCWAFEMSDPS